MQIKNFLIPFFLFNTPVQATEPLNLYSPEGVYIQHSDIPLSKDASLLLDILKLWKQYYAAFSININENIYSVVTGHNPEFVKQHALNRCHLRSNEKTACIIYATILSENYNATKGSNTLDSDASQKITTTYQANLKTGYYGAIAINDAGHFGWATEKVIGHAINKAHKLCKDDTEVKREKRAIVKSGV